MGVHIMQPLGINSKVNNMFPEKSRTAEETFHYRTAMQLYLVINYKQPRAYATVCIAQTLEKMLVSV